MDFVSDPTQISTAGESLNISDTSCSCEKVTGDIRTTCVFGKQRRSRGTKLGAVGLSAFLGGCAIGLSSFSFAVASLRSASSRIPKRESCDEKHPFKIVDVGRFESIPRRGDTLSTALLVDPNPVLGLPLGQLLHWVLETTSEFLVVPSKLMILDVGVADTFLA